MPPDTINEALTALPLEASEFAALMAGCVDEGALGAGGIAVGVSGGADSMALVLLADFWARERGFRLTALTVDHGLRTAAADEAARVSEWLGQRGISHHILRISRARPRAGVQKAAREWRFTAFGAWCRDNGAGPILLAHTREDQAETFCLRVAADSGPDGLAAMRPQARVSGLEIARPLLSVSKRRLVATCRARGQDWIEDPSNLDRQYTRVRLRNLAPQLADVGLGVDQTTRIAGAMAVARAEMDRHCATFLRVHGGVTLTGVVWFDARQFKRLPEKFQEILLSRLTRAIGGAELPPRRARVRRLTEGLRDSAVSTARTLAGCIILQCRNERVWLFREPEKVAGKLSLKAGKPERWDNRFELFGQAAAARWLGALGEDGWCWIKKNDPKTIIALGLDKLPHAARLSIPVIHELDGTVSVPHFETGDGARHRIPGSRVMAGFSPDDQWIRPLIAAFDAG